MNSPCCGVPCYVAYGEFLCGNCWDHVEQPKRDIIAWLFPAERGPKPAGELIFVRYGSRIQYITSAQIRGRPDSWSWSGA